MKIGILNAIPPELSQVNWQGSPVDAYVRFFQSGSGDFQFVGYEVAHGEFPDSPEACDAYIITGSPKGVYDADEWIGRLVEFIRASYVAGKKLIGICFGHQILAQALGGRAEKSEKGWGLGLKRIELNADRSKAWLDGRVDHCALYFVHQDQVTELPPGAELLGGSEFCPNAFFTIDNQVLGLQGHPEFSLAIMQDILSRERVGVDTKLQATAVNSLRQGDPDNQMMAQWLVNFLLV